jgi:hypothetical protein
VGPTRPYRAQLFAAGTKKTNSQKRARTKKAGLPSGLSGFDRTEPRGPSLGIGFVFPLEGYTLFGKEKTKTQIHS